METSKWLSLTRPFVTGDGGRAKRATGGRVGEGGAQHLINIDKWVLSFTSPRKPMFKPIKKLVWQVTPQTYFKPILNLK